MLKILTCALFASFFASASLLAEELPLCRYAFKYWKPAPYRADIFYKGFLTKDEKAVVKYLRSCEKHGVITLSVSNLSQPRQCERKSLWLWQKQKSKILPLLLIRYPKESEQTANAWSGSLNLESTMRIMNSPKRAKSARLLIGGADAVWILLESGYKAKDENAAVFLKSALHEFKESNPHLKLSFPVLRIRANENEERFFAKLLRRVKKETVRIENPIAIPLFGRGRALCSLSEKLMDQNSVKEACALLIKPCLGNGKEQPNIKKPGSLDMLIETDWRNKPEKAKKKSPRKKESKDDGKKARKASSGGYFMPFQTQIMVFIALVFIVLVGVAISKARK